MAAAPQMVNGVPMISFVGDGFCLPYPMDLIVKRKQYGFSNIRYEVADVHGNLLLFVDGFYMTFYREKELAVAVGRQWNDEETRQHECK